MTDHGRPNGVELGRLCAPVAASSSKAARRLLEVIGTAWALSESVIYRAQLATAELVANVVLHAPGAQVTISIHRTGDNLTVQVHDASPKAPVLRVATEDDESGRGMLLIAEFTDDFGHCLTPSGKISWFEIKTDWPLDAAA